MTQSSFQASRLFVIGWVVFGHAYPTAQPLPRHAAKVVRRVLFRRTIVIDAETAQLAAAAPAALQAGAPSRPPWRAACSPADCEPLFWISSAAVASGIPGLDASQALHAMITATVTDTAAAAVVLDLLRRGQG